MHLAAQSIRKNSSNVVYQDNFFLGLPPELPLDQFLNLQEYSSKFQSITIKQIVYRNFFLGLPPSILLDHHQEYSSNFQIGCRDNFFLGVPPLDHLLNHQEYSNNFQQIFKQNFCRENILPLNLGIIPRIPLGQSLNHQVRLHRVFTAHT